MHLIVHGGAGGAPYEPEERHRILDEAAAAGAAEPTPLDAVEVAVRRLEASSRFNAGVGGAIQSDGGVRTDAGIMTEDRSAGAVAGMAGVAHAVTVARAVMEETPHVLLAGDPAVEFAEAMGVEASFDLYSDRNRERWAELDPPADLGEQVAWIRERFGRDDENDTVDDAPSRGSSDHDTVGAVATDGESVAAATSTGGRWLALAGRVGDVPQIGSGFYCSPAGGASATGAGEDIARVTLSRLAVDHLEAGADAETAAERAIEEFERVTESSAGIVVCDREGRTGFAYNTAAMQVSVSTH